MRLNDTFCPSDGETWYSRTREPNFRKNDFVYARNSPSGSSCDVNYFNVFAAVGGYKWMLYIRNLDMIKYLAGQDAYAIDIPTCRRFRRRIYSKGIDDLLKIDLTDMPNLSAYNDGYRYLLNCIDIFTKCTWSVMLNTITGREVSDVFERHIPSERWYNMMQSDKGTEFLILPSSPCCYATVYSFT